MNIQMNSSEPYTIIDSVTRKTIKQMINLEKAIAELWERRSRGENVDLLGDLHSSEKRGWEEIAVVPANAEVIQTEDDIVVAV